MISANAQNLDYVELMQDAVRDLEKLLKDEGINDCSSQVENLWDTYRSYDVDRQAALYQQTKDFLTSLQNAKSEGVSLLNDVAYTAHWVNNSPYKPHCDIDYSAVLKQGEAVEAYNSDGIQIFRNMVFYRSVAYSPGDMAIIPFYDLYTRSADLTEKIIKIAFQKGFSGIKEPYKFDVPPHWCHQNMSDGAGDLWVTFKTLVPLFDESGEPAVILGTSTIELKDNKGA